MRAPLASSPQVHAFATHYFELTALAERTAASPRHLDAVEHGGSLAVHAFGKAGPADRSFGRQWRLAGLPKTVVRQARARLAELEAQNRDAPSTPMTAQALDAPQQIGLFSPSSATLEALAAIDPDELTPKQALEALYRLKALP